MHARQGRHPICFTRLRHSALDVDAFLFMGLEIVMKLTNTQFLATLKETVAELATANKEDKTFVHVLGDDWEVQLPAGIRRAMAKAIGRKKTNKAFHRRFDRAVIAYWFELTNN